MIYERVFKDFKEPMTKATLDELIAMDERNRVNGKG